METIKVLALKPFAVFVSGKKITAQKGEEVEIPTYYGKVLLKNGFIRIIEGKLEPETTQQKQASPVQSSSTKKKVTPKKEESNSQTLPKSTTTNDTASQLEQKSLSELREEAISRGLSVPKTATKKQLLELLQK